MHLHSSEADLLDAASRQPTRSSPTVVPDWQVQPDETLWACTTCGWCETACPVFIEHVPRIIDMRRYLVMLKSGSPTE